MSNQKRFALIGVGTQLEEAGAGVLGDLAAYTDPNDDRLFGWDDSADATIGFDLGAGLITSGTSVLLDSAIFTSVTTAQLTMAATEIQLDGALDFNATSFTLDATTAVVTVANPTFVGTPVSVRLVDSAQGSNEKNWAISNQSASLLVRTFTDDFLSSEAAYQIERTGSQVDSHTLYTNGSAVRALFSSAEIELNATTLDLNGAADLSGALTMHAELTGATRIELTHTAPSLTMINSDDATDETTWVILPLDTGLFEIRAYSDNLGSNSTAFRITRTGTTIDEVELSATTLDFNGNVDVSGEVIAHGTARAVSLEAANPVLRWIASDADADEENWWMQATTSAGVGILRIRAVNDAESAATEAFRILRSGTTIDEIELNATTLDFNGSIDLDVSSGLLALDVGGGYVNITGASTSGTIAALLNNVLPRLGLLETDAAADNQLWYIDANIEQFAIAVVNDARTVVTDAIRIDRTGTTVDLVQLLATEVDLTATTLDFNGAADISGTLNVGGTLSTVAISATGGITVTNTVPSFRVVETGVTANNTTWGWAANAEALNGLLYSDDLSATASFIVVNRTNNTIDEVELNGTLLDFNGDLDADGTTMDIDGATSLGLHGGSVDIAMSSSTFNITLGGAFEVDGPNIWISSTSGPYLRLSDDDATSGARNIRLRSVNGQFVLSTENDSNTQIETALIITVNGSSQVTEVQLDGDAFDLNANMTVPSGWTLTTEGGTLTFSGTGETLATFADDGAVTLYHDNAIALATTTTGADIGAGATVHFRVDGSSTATHTRMLVYDVDNATLERVTVGAADSGGAGFKVLRIPN